MGIRYEAAPDVESMMREICEFMFPHVKLDSVSCIRSYGSKSSRTIARCHALGKAMQLGMGRKIGFYVIEVINKHYDFQSEDDKIKTIIHEIMHIPKTFGGGFRHHDYVCDRNVEIAFQKYINLKRENVISSYNEGDKSTLDDASNSEVIIKEQRWW